MNLKHLTDKQLIKDTKQLAQEDRNITAKLLHHIKEIDCRKLYSDLGYSSLFTYVVQELGFSEGAAGRRINAAKLLNSLPEIEKKIVNGDLTLSNVSKAAEKFKQEGITNPQFQKDVLSTIENTSTRTCEKTLSEIVGPSKLPLEVRMPIFHTILMTDENHRMFQKIRDLLSHKKLSKDMIWEKILGVALEKIEEDMFKTKTKSTSNFSNSRYIPTALKKEVYLRDKSCRKCGSTYALQFDHITPYALGGKTEIKNLRLLCRNCNQRSRISSRLKGYH